MHLAVIAIAPYAALLSLVYVALSIRVARYRARFRLSLGCADDDGMQRAVRSHANFMEYVPLALLMLLLCAVSGASAALINVLGLVLVAARLLHIYSIVIFEPTRRRHILRPVAMVGTFFVLITASFFLLWQWAGIWL